MKTLYFLASMALLFPGAAEAASMGGGFVARWAIAPIVAAAIISAAAAAASGIAGAAGSASAANAQAADSERQRRLQEKLAKLQLAEQRRQGQASALQATQQTLGSTYQDAAQTGLNRAAERQSSRKSLVDSLSRTFLG
jgi:hypothetical protein